MNNFHKTIFNRALGIWQVVSELAKSHGKGGRGASSFPVTVCHDSGDRNDHESLAFRHRATALVGLFAALSVVAPAWGQAVSATGDVVVINNDDSETAIPPGAQPNPWHPGGRALSIGYSGVGILTVTGGGSVFGLEGWIGGTPGSDGTVTVDGIDSIWDNAGQLYADGTLNITNGGSVSNNYGYVGSESGLQGTVTVNGAGSKWTNNSLVVGADGIGTLNIANGGSVISSLGGTIGFNIDAIGKVTVESGGTWTNGSDLDVGEGGVGELNITSGGKVANATGRVGGNLAGEGRGRGVVTVSGTGSEWKNDTGFIVGVFGDGELTVSNGGSVISNGDSVVGFEADSVGTVTVEDAGSTWMTSGVLPVGYSGTGTLNVVAGGHVSIGDELQIGRNAQSNGELTIAGGGKVSNAGTGSIGMLAGSTGTVTVTGANSTWQSANLAVGYGGTGDLIVTNGGTVDSIVSGTNPGVGTIGQFLGSVGTATVGGGSGISTWKNANSFFIGHEGTGTLSVIGGGSVSSNNQLFVGGGALNGIDGAGTGVLKIEAGGIVSNTGAGFIGYGDNATGTVTVDGGTWTNGGLLAIGGGGSTGSGVTSGIGSGTLMIRNGGKVSNTRAVIGTGTSHTGTVTVDGVGSTWDNAGSLLVGNDGPGILAITNGGRVTSTSTTATNDASSHIGYAISAEGAVTIDGQGSSWTVTGGTLFIGYSSTGALTLANDGVVKADNVMLGGTVVGKALLNIGAASGSAPVAPGTLDAPSVQFGSSGLQKALVFNHTNTTGYTFAPVISGAGTVDQLAGTTILIAASTYTGATTVNGGTLQVDGSTDSVTTVNTGGTLTGKGTISQNVTVADGGTLAGAAGQTLTMNGLTLNQTSNVNVTLGAPSTTELFKVNGDLVLDGTLNVSNAGGFGNGLYRIIDYTGSLTNNDLGIGSAPTGYNASNLTVQALSGSQQVNLIVGAVSTSAYNYWNIGGGTWNATNTNWTNFDGSAVGVYDPAAQLFFTGPGGTVTVDGGGNPLPIGAGIQFFTSGYTLTGGGLALTLPGPDTSFMVGDGTAAGSGMTATIASAITGTGVGGVVKDGLGTLVLTGQNNWGGVTAVEDGEMRISGGGSVSNGDAGLIGNDADSHGTVTVDGANSKWTNGGDLVVGDMGTGTLNITGGGSVSSAYGVIGNDAAAQGTVTVSGADSKWINGADLDVGYGGSGALNIENGGAVSSHGGSVGQGMGSKGEVTVTGDGSSWTNVGGDLVIGDGNAGGNGTLDILNGGHVSNSNGWIALEAGSVGVVLVDGTGTSGASTWTNTGNLSVGVRGFAGLAVMNGGRVFNSDGLIGANPSADGLVTVDGAGSMWTNNGFLYVGSGGVGELAVRNGGSVSSSTGSIGSNNALGNLGDGTVTVDGPGSTWNSGSSLVVGNGRLNIQNGGLVSASIVTFGFDDGSGTLRLNGTTAARGVLEVGALAKSGGAAAVHLDGGILRATADTASFPWPVGYAADFFSGFAAGDVTLDAGGAFIDSNGHAVDTAASLGGIGGLTKQGIGTLTLSGASNYTGATAIDAGTLKIDGSIASATTVNTGGTLTGKGTINQNVTVAGGGTLAGTAGQTLTMSGLTLNPTSIVDVTLGAPSTTELFKVNGNLILDGTLNVSNAGGFGDGLYRIIDYTGSLTDNGLDIGSAPAGYSAGDLAVQALSGSQQVNLIVGAVSASSYNFWNVGSGIWNAVNTNWSNIDNTASGTYDPAAQLIFAGPGGTVAVDGGGNPLPIGPGIQFAASGYSVQGDGLALTAPVTAFRVGDSTAAGASMTATIASNISSGAANSVEKTDLGTLTLSGLNNFGGGLTLTGGAVSVASNANLGTNLNGLHFAGGTLLINGSLAFDGGNNAATSQNLSIPAGSSGAMLIADGATLTISNNIAGSAISIASGGALTIAPQTTGGTGRVVFEGNATTGSGGAINASGGSLTLANVTFTGNSAENNGGAVSVSGLVGGGILITGNLTATGNTARDGGALYTGLGDIVQDNGDVILGGPTAADGNRATISDGGAIFVEEGNLSLAATSGNITLSNNYANSDGGAIKTYQGSATLGNSNGTVTLNNNTAANHAGGAIYSHRDLKITGSTITLNDNQALGIAGGGDGGALFANGRIDLIGDVIANNNSGFGGAGAIGTLSTVTASGNISMDGNTASVGGAIYAAGAVSLATNSGSNASLTNNHALGTVVFGDDGGAIYSQGGLVTVGNTDGASTEISGNSAVGSGGAIWSGNIVTLYASDISGNKAVGGDGGAVYASSIELTGTAPTTTISNNSAGGKGGAIWAASSVALTSLGGDIVFSGNKQGTAGTPQANAIWLEGVSGAGGSLSLDTAGHTITFRDPVQNNAANGALTVNAMGGGSVVFDGADYSAVAADRWSKVYGNTTVQNGTTFTVQNGAVYGVKAADVGSTANSSFTAAIGATLSGGSGGAVRADNITVNGNLEGVSGDILTLDGNLTLGSDANVNVTLGAPSTTELFKVNGNLILDGMLNVSNAGGFGDGLYRIIDYTGSLTDNGLDIGSAPAGYNAANLAVQALSDSQQVNLIVGAVSTSSYNFWNVGSDIWNAVNTNWSNIDNTASGTYDPAAQLIFAGPGGTVTVDGGGNPLPIGTGIQFAASGYSVQGDGLALTAPVTAFRVGDSTAAGASMTATIASALSGGGSVLKDDLGTLTLTGVNTYSGGTTISAGTLTGSATSFGSGAITDNAALVLDQASNATFANAISGSGTVAKTGAGNLTLTGANTYSGGTTISAGTLTGSATSFGTGAITDNAALVFDQASNATFANAISGSGTVAKTGAGNLTLTGANTYSGGTTISAGTLTGSATSFGSGAITDNAALVFDQASSATFANAIGGSGTVAKTGAGALTLTGANTYTGATAINGGTLKVDGSLASATTVNAGGTLAGSGSIGNSVTVAAGGTLSGASGSTLAMNSLALDANANVDAVLGAPSATELFKVNGNLTLDGKLNISGTGAFGDGLYRLFDYTGTLTDRGLDIGATPTGYAADTLMVHTAEANHVNLLVGSSSVFNFWNGSDTRANGTLAGGSGTWNASGDNWTNASAASSDSYDLTRVLIFAGARGTVTVDAGGGSLAVGPGLQFATSGYVVEGDGLALGAGKTTFQVGDGSAAGAGYTATVASVLSGAGGIEKTDRGTLALTGVNTYSGGTTISAGTLTGSAASFGTGAITNNAALVIDQSANASFANAIGGSGSLTKQGAGALTLTGTHGYTGATAVNAGTLLVNGSIANSNVAVNGGRLGGNGTLGGLIVRNGATLAPGNSIGAINVNGPVTFEPGSFYEVEIDAAGNSDLTRATGVATIDGGTVKVLAADGNYALSTRYTILTAGGGRTGEFDEVTSNLAFLTPSLGYDANNVYLTMDRNGIDFASVGGTPNQRSAGAGVESLGAGQPVWDAVVRLDAPGARIAFDQLSGEIHASAKTALIEDSRFVREAAVDRLRSGLNSDGHESVAWARFFGSWGRVSGDGNAAELDRSTGGFFAGADARLSGDWRGGVLAGYSRGNFDTDDRRSSGDSDNYHLGLYAGTQWGRLGLRVGAAYTWHDLSTSRVVGFQGFTEGLRGDYHANTTQVFGELGYGIDAGAAKLEPFANLAHVTLHTDGFTERGGAAALAGRSGNESTTFATLGLRVSSRGFELGGMKASATGSLGWRHAFGDVTPYSALRFAGAGNAFGIAGVPIAKDAAALDAGLEFSIGKNATLGLSYNGQFGSGLRDHGGRVDLRMKF